MPPTIKETRKRGNVQELLRLASSSKLISEDEKVLTVKFPMDDAEKYLPHIQDIQGLRGPKPVRHDPDGDTPEEQVTILHEYTVPNSDENLQTLAKFGRQHRFDFDGDLAVRAQLESDEGKNLYKLSFATKSDFAIPKLGCRKPNCDICHAGKLLEFQPAGVEYMVNAERTFNADEMGTGKTIQCCAGIATVGEFPWLIVVPAGLRKMWRRTLEHWLLPIRHDGQKLNIAIADNRNFQFTTRKVKGERVEVISRATQEFLAGISILIVSYDRVGKYRKFLKTVPWVGVIFDESHKLKAKGAKRARVIRDFMQRDISPTYVWMNTGTPLMNRPVDLVNQLRVMDRLDDFGGESNFIRRYCSLVAVDEGAAASASAVVTAKSKSKLGSADEEQQRLIEEERAQDALTRRMHENMVALNDQLRSTCYIRRDKTDVLKDLPEKNRAVIPIDIDNREQYEKIRADVIAYLMELAVQDKKFLDSIKKLSADEQKALINRHRNETAQKYARSRAIAELNRLKHAAAIGKLRAAKDWIQDYLETGQKLVVFCHHHDVRNELIDFFPRNITVNTRDMDGDTAEQEFQTDPNKRLFIGSLSKDGEGRTLTAASATCTLEFWWTPAAHDQAEDRVWRIGQRNAVMAYYLVAANTVEEKIADLIERKRKMVHAVADGDPLKGKEIGNIKSLLIREMTKETPNLFKARKRKRSHSEFMSHLDLLEEKPMRKSKTTKPKSKSKPAPKKKEVAKPKKSKTVVKAKSRPTAATKTKPKRKPIVFKF